METFATSIKRKYQEGLIYREKQWPPCRSDKLVRLELVEREKGEGYCANIQRGRKDNAVKRTPLAYGDLFKVESGKKPVRKVLVEGDAGIGKTTLCISVSEDWANGKLFQQFKLVLLLPLRMKTVASAGSLPELLKLLHPSPRLCDSVARYLEEGEGENVLIIADGWDELSESERKEGSFLNQLLFQLFLFMSIVVTSRPSASAPLHDLPNINRYVEVLGFSKEYIAEYIRSEFTSDPEKADRLLKQLEYNPLVESVCSVPLSCAIVCHLWRTLEEALPTTMTQLYKKLILNIILRNVQKEDEFKHVKCLSNFDSLPMSLRKSWYHLCKFAFQAMVGDKIVFSEEELSCFFPQGLDKVLCFGLLQTAECILETGCETSFYFLHLTIQEYLAALHFVNLSSEEQLEHFQSHHSESSKFKCLSTMVYRFFFGIYFMSDIQRHDLNFEVVINYLAQNGTPSIGFNALLLCHCAFEAQNKAITENVVSRLGKSGGFDAAINIDDLHTLPLTDHPHTAHDCAAVLYVMSKMQEGSLAITFSNSGVTENQIRTLTHMLISSFKRVQVTKLNLRGNKLTDGCVIDLFNTAPFAFSLLSELDLGSNTIGDESIKYITKALENSKCYKLVKLDLSHNALVLSNMQKLACTGLLANVKWLFLEGAFTNDPDISPEWVTNFLNAMLEHCLCLKILDISQNKLQVNKSGASVLGKIMSRCKVVLLGLNPHSAIVDIHHPISDKLQITLSKTCLGDEGLSTFIENLGGQSQFSRLELQDNGISAKGISCLADSICQGNIIIQGHVFPDIYDEDCCPDPNVLLEEVMEKVELHLDGNPLGLGGTKKIGKMLGSGHCQVKTLSLKGCQLTTDLSDNGECNDSVAVCNNIGEYLNKMHASTTVTHLFLDYNRFTKEGIQILVGYISLCSTLTVLSTCFCGITSNDLSQLLDQLVRLKSSIPNLFNTLTVWYLSNNEIDNGGLSVLLKNLQEPSLFPYPTWSSGATFDLQNNLISTDMMRKLEEEHERRQKIGMRSLQEQFAKDWIMMEEREQLVENSTTMAEMHSNESYLHTSLPLLPLPTVATESEPGIVSISPAGSGADTQCDTMLISNTDDRKQHHMQKSISWPNQLHISSLVTTQPLLQKPVNTLQQLVQDRQIGDHQKTADYSNLAVEHHFLDLIEWEDANGVRRQLRIYSKIAHKWRQIATRLGFELGEIESIDADYHTSDCRITVVFRRWFENAKNLPNARRYPKSWQGLINLLEDAQLGEVAEELKRALSSPQNMVVRGDLP